MPDIFTNKKPTIRLKLMRVKCCHNCLSSTVTCMSYEIARFYLPPDRGDVPAITPVEAGTRFIDPEAMKGWVDLSHLV